MKVINKEDLLQNDELHIKLRKSEKTLAISGFMVLTFGVWDIIRLIFQFIFNTSSVMEKVEKTGMLADFLDLQDTFDLHELGMTILILFMLSLVAVSIIMVLAIRIIIWKGAVRESRGERSDVIYIVLSVIMLITNMGQLFATSSRFGDYSYIDLTKTEDEIIEAVFDYISSIPEMTISTILSITSIVLFLELVLSALLVKRYRKKLAGYSNIKNRDRFYQGTGDASVVKTEKVGESLNKDDHIEKTGLSKERKFRDQE